VASKVFGKTTKGKMTPATDAVNNAGGIAYAFTDKHALAQIACTGTFNSTYYSDPEKQLGLALDFAEKVPVEFLAKVAVYARKSGKMKDMPALLGAVLSRRDPKMWAKVFSTVIDDVRMLRSFVQIIRSGRTGRKSLGKNNRELIRAWFASKTPDQLFRMSVGSNPSLGDVIKLAHVKPTDDQKGIFKLLLGKKTEGETLPDSVMQYRQYRSNTDLPQPNVPVEMIQDFMPEKGWQDFAKRASMMATIRNIKKFAEKGSFNDREALDSVVNRLKSKEQLAKSNVLPYQIMQTMFACESSLNGTYPEVVNAIHDAMENAVDLVPDIPGKVWVFVDVSGSMGSAVTEDKSNGHGSSVRRVRCVEAAALIASAILRKNPIARIVPFETRIHNVSLRARDSILTNAETLAKFCGGGTNCSLPMHALAESKEKADVVIYVSDNESWIDSWPRWHYQGTSSMDEWNKVKANNPKAKLVCIDLTPNTTTQVKSNPDVLNIGGWSDEVFSVIAKFCDGNSSEDRWVKEIESIEI